MSNAKPNSDEFKTNLDDLGKQITNSKKQMYNTIITVVGGMIGFTAGTYLVISKLANRR